MWFSFTHYILFSLIFADGIIFSFGNDECMHMLDNTDQSFIEIPITFEIKGVPNEYSSNLQIRLQMKIGPDSKFIMGEPFKAFLFGKISSTVDLAKLSFLHRDIKFCNINFNDLDNFLGSLENNGILLEQFFAVTSPCVQLGLNNLTKLDKLFLSSNYVLQTPNMLITNIGVNQTRHVVDMIYEFVEPLTLWLLYGGKIGLTKRLEIRGGKMEIVALLMKNLIMLHHKKKLEEKNNFVLKLHGFALESFGLVEFTNGNTLGLKRISDSIWELHYHDQGVMKEKDDEHGGNEDEQIGKQKVDAIFEIDKFEF